LIHGGAGAEQVIDYETERFGDSVQRIDVVVDGVGGATLQRSWTVLGPNGRMVTIAAAASDCQTKGRRTPSSSSRRIRSS